MTEVVSTTAAIRHAKLQSNCPITLAAYTVTRVCSIEVNPFQRLTEPPTLSIIEMSRRTIANAQCYVHWPSAGFSEYRQRTDCIIRRRRICCTQTQWHRRFGLGDATVMYSYFCLCFNGHFPAGPGLAGTNMSPFWTLLELRMMEVVVTTGAVRRAKVQSNRHH